MNARAKSLHEMAVSDEIRTEIEQLLIGMPDEVSCVLGGSLVEGFGNEHSDVDAYAIFEETQPSASTAIGLRKSRYVDVENVTVQSLRQLIVRVETSGWFDPSDALPDIDRYFRLAGSVSIRSSNEVRSLLGTFDLSLATRRFAQYALIAWQNWLVRSAVQLELGESEGAKIMAQTAYRWRAAHSLALAGEGYPSLKWNAEKAARRFGRGSKEFSELIDPCYRSVVDVPKTLAHLREQFANAECEIDPLRRPKPDFKLAEAVRVVESSGGTFLVNAKRELVLVSGLRSAAVHALDGGSSWSVRAASVANELNLPVEEVDLVAGLLLRPLVTAGYVTQSQEIIR